MIELVKREYVLAVPTSKHGDVNYISLKAYDVSDAILGFKKEYPSLQRSYILSNLQDLTEIEEIEHNNGKEIY